MPDKKKLRVIIDTNLLISAMIVTKSPPDKLIKSWLKDSFTLLVSYKQLEEIKDASRRGKLRTYPLFTKRVTELIDNIEVIAETVEPIPDKDLPIHSRDPEDDFLIASALGGNADSLVTGDEDLLALNGTTALGKLKIITAREFLGLI